MSKMSKMIKCECPGCRCDKKISRRRSSKQCVYCECGIHR